MAHIETVQTGFRVITHVRGRVTRYQAGQSKQRRPEQSLTARLQVKTRVRLRICLLSAKDAEHLEEYQISQPCQGPGCRHTHHSREQIAALVKSGDLRWVGGSENVAAWGNPREWRGGGLAMQWVPLGSGISRLEQRELARASFVNPSE